MTKNRQEKEIFFHVGLGKTASTYLQYKVFPKLKGVYYIQRTRYKRYKEIISKTEHDKYFISNEFDRQLEREVKKFSQSFPEGKVIIVLRRNDSWIASQYRRHVKNGRAFLFEEFFDLENDSGFWKKEDLYIFPKIQVIEKYLHHKPLVLFHDDLKNHPHDFISLITHFIGATYDPNKIKLDPKHTSYNEKQLKAIRKFSKLFFKQERKTYKNIILKKIQEKRRWLCYLVMYSALLIPDSWMGKEKLIPQNQLDKVRDFYADDWGKCLNMRGNIPATSKRST